MKALASMSSAAGAFERARRSVSDIMIKFGETDATNKIRIRQSDTPPDVAGTLTGARSFPGPRQFTLPPILLKQLKRKSGGAEIIRKH